MEMSSEVAPSLESGSEIQKAIYDRVITVEDLYEQAGNLQFPLADQNGTVLGM